MPKTSEPQSLLLDTHIWLWLVQGNSRLRSPARGAISRAATAGRLRIAAITVWEIALLSSRKRVVLGKPLARWVDDALAASGVGVEPLSPRIAVESCELPDGLHGDPADRIIVATARLADLVLITRDRRILDYASEGHLKTIAA
jgi:PIN domain nuclease of toxin-antitoxin system